MATAGNTSRCRPFMNSPSGTLLTILIIGGVIVRVLFSILPCVAWGIGILLALFVGINAVGVIIERRVRRRLIKKYSNRVILVWQSRRNWGTFIQNNVIPVLPSCVEAIQDLRDRDFAGDVTIVQDRLDGTILPRRRASLSRPFIFFVEGDDFQFVELHRHLQPLKQFAKRDCEVQAKVKEIMVRELRSSGLTTPIG